MYHYLFQITLWVMITLAERLRVYQAVLPDWVKWMCRREFVRSAYVRVRKPLRKLKFFMFVRNSRATFEVSQPTDRCHAERARSGCNQVDYPSQE